MVIDRREALEGHVEDRGIRRTQMTRTNDKAMGHVDGGFGKVPHSN